MKRVMFILLSIVFVVLAVRAVVPNILVGGTGGIAPDFCLISTNAISFYYRLDEAAGSQKVDATGQLANLTETTSNPQSYPAINTWFTNSIGFDSTKTQHLTGTSSANVADITNGDAAFTFWFYTSNTANAQVCIQKGQFDTLAGGYSINITAGAGAVLQFTLMTTNGIGAPTTTTAIGTDVIASNSWNFGCAQFCRASNYVAISLNDGAFSTASVPSANQPKPNSVALRFGAGTAAAPPGTTARLLGMLDEAGKWNRMLATNEVTCLYHAGTHGAAFPSPSTYPWAMQMQMDAVTNLFLARLDPWCGRELITTRRRDYGKGE